MKNESEPNPLYDKDELERQNDKLKFYRTLQAQIKLYDNSFKELINRLYEMVCNFKKFFPEIFASLISVNEGKLTYRRVNGINQVQEQLKEILYSSEYEGVYGFAFHLNNSGLPGNKFNPELIMLFDFNEYKYYIVYRICQSFELSGVDIDSTKGSYNSLIANYYHQQLSKEAIDLICNEIREDLSAYFKTKF